MEFGDVVSFPVIDALLKKVFSPRMLHKRWETGDGGGVEDKKRKFGFGYGPGRLSEFYERVGKEKKRQLVRCDGDVS